MLRLSLPLEDGYRDYNFYTSTRQCEVLPNLLQEHAEAEQAEAEEPELGGDCVARAMQAVLGLCRP